jgi:2-iminobutanoate/2-iminopropanoate deaminase
MGAGIRAQTKQCLESVKAILLEAGMYLFHIAKITIYMTDLNDFMALNEVYQEYFETDPPARVCVEVKRLPKDVLVEIDAIALRQ